MFRTHTRWRRFGLFVLAISWSCLGSLLCFAKVTPEADRPCGSPDAGCEPYYWVHCDYSRAAEDTGFSRSRILQFGVRRFSEMFDAQYEKREGKAPTESMGNEQAELIYLWVRRQDNLRRLALLPQRDQAVVRRLDAVLTQMERCETAQRKEETSGGTGWLAEMRRIALRHEGLMFQLIHSHRRWRRRDHEARTAFKKSMHDLERAIRTDETNIKRHAGDPDYYYESPDYRRALSGFHSHLERLRRIVASTPPPDGVLRALAEYLPECWWQQFDADLDR